MTVITVLDILAVVAISYGLLKYVVPVVRNKAVPKQSKKKYKVILAFGILLLVMFVAAAIN